jgi:hypothetical protein
LVLLFLYHRLHQTASRQLESLKKYDYAALERLTVERENITRDLCRTIEQVGDGEDAEAFSESVRRKIHELTSKTLHVDAEIKELLLDDLKEKTRELDDLCPRETD